MSRTIRIGLILILASILTSGCWDRVEIDERGFVIGVAIDAVESDAEAKEESEEQPAKLKYRVTYQMAVTAALKQAGGSGGGAVEKAFYNIEAEEATMSTVSAKISSKTSRSPFFEHLKVIIISDKIAKQKGALVDILDFYIRDSEMRRAVKVMIAKGEASKVLGVTPPNEKLPSMFINSVAENNRKSIVTLKETRIGDVQEYLLSNESFLLQQISTPSKEEVTIMGAGLVDGSTNRLIGFLNAEETAGTNLITGELKGGIVRTIIDQQWVGFEIERAKKKLRVDFSDPNHMKFKLTFIAEGGIVEEFKQMDLITLDGSLPNIEKAVETEMERLSSMAIKKAQKNYEKDVFGFRSYLYRKHYPIWKVTHKDWEQGEKLFAKADIEVNAEVTIRRTGSVIKSAKEK